MAKRVFDEDRTRPGIQGMPRLKGGGNMQAQPIYRRQPGNPGADQLQRYVDAQTALLRAEQDAETQRQQGSPMAAYMARRRVQQQTQALETQRKGLTAKPAAVVSQPAQAATADPVVSVPADTTTTTDAGTPAAPVAVTDPASEISPEEQIARLRARLLLMSGGQRGGRLASTMGSQLGYRGLLGL